MNYIIEEANEEDRLYCNKLLTKLIKDEKQYDDNIDENYEVTSYYEKIINDNNILLVAKHSNKIVGYLYGYIKDDKVSINPTSVLDALYVEEEYRKK